MSDDYGAEGDSSDQWLNERYEPKRIEATVMFLDVPQPMAGLWAQGMCGRWWSVRATVSLLLSSTRKQGGWMRSNNDKTERAHRDESRQQVIEASRGG